MKIAAKISVKNYVALGERQYQKYVADNLDLRIVFIHDMIKKNSPPLFKSQKPKVKSKSAQQLIIPQDKDNVSLFGRLYIPHQKLNGDIEASFCHEI